LCPRGGAFDTRRRGFPHKQVGLLTQHQWSRIPIEPSSATPFGKDRRALYASIHIHTQTVCFLKWKRKAAVIGYNERYNPVCTVSDLLRTRNSLQVLTIFPRNLSGVPPDPVPPLRLRMQRLGVHSSKLGGAGGSPRSFGRRPKPRSPSATMVASAALLAGCCGARLGARGRPARADAVA